MDRLSQAQESLVALIKLSPGETPEMIELYLDLATQLGEVKDRIETLQGEIDTVLGNPAESTTSDPLKG